MALDSPPLRESHSADKESPPRSAFGERERARRRARVARFDALADLPVRYRARTYGDTKISRFRHGFMLARMTAFGFKKLRMGS